jgi:hypothetical protein
MIEFISNGKSKHLPKGQVFTVTQEIYDIFLKAKYVELEKVKKEK